MTIAGQVNSPVAISESPLFRRKFSSIYDVLLEGDGKRTNSQQSVDFGIRITC
jgi:hypothetical protein